METKTRLCLLLLMLPLMVYGGKKGKKDRRTPPQWKPSSMPAMNKRFESVYEGSDLSLDCKAQSDPKPSVKWLKDGVELRNTNNVEVKKFNLALRTLTTDMSGNYTCVVSNKLGHINWTFHLDVQVKLWPLIIEGPNNITQMTGSNVAFRCRVINDPGATIRWHKMLSNKNMEERPQADFLPDGSDPNVLKLDNIQKSDEGEYRCMAGNIWGLKHSSAWLTVIEPVLRPDLPRLSEKNRNNNINANDIVEAESQGEFDPKEQDTLDNSIYEGGYSREDLDPSDYGPDLYFATTKRPKNRNNNRKKNDRKKDKKGKEKILEDAFTSTTTYFERLQKTTISSEIWQFEDNNNEHDEVSDSRYNPVKTSDEDIVDDTSNDSNNSEQDVYIEGSISSWTIYTIVGSIGGVILLIGLVAITLTICCKREEGNVYKSTPV
ncbi:hypothetical protein BsWGS_05068 [Bradybaena similaris]